MPTDRLKSCPDANSRESQFFSTRYRPSLRNRRFNSAASEASPFNFNCASGSGHWRRWPFDDTQLAIRQTGQSWRVKSKILSSPPHAGRSLFGKRSAPVLPDDSACKFRGSTREWIAGKECNNVGAIGEQALLGTDHKHVVAPGAE